MSIVFNRKFNKHVFLLITMLYYMKINYQCRRCTLTYMMNYMIQNHDVNCKCPLSEIGFCAMSYYYILPLIFLEKQAFMFVFFPFLHHWQLLGTIDCIIQTSVTPVPAFTPPNTPFQHLHS